MTLGQEFSTYAVMLGEDEQRLREACAADPRDQSRRDRDRHRHQRASRLRRASCAGKLSDITGIPLVTAPNLVEATQDCGAFVQLSGVLKRVAVKLSKTCNDLRLLSSGPRAGLGEINLPPMQAGSSHHAGQGQPGDSRGRQPDRVRSHRQRRDGDVSPPKPGSCSSMRSSRSSRTACSRVSKHLRNGCLTLAERCVNGHHREPRALCADRRALDRHRHGAESVYRLRERDAGGAGSAGERQKRIRARAGKEAALQGKARRHVAPGESDAAEIVLGLRIVD